MKSLKFVATVMVLLASVSFVSAEEIKSGLQAGDLIDAFYVTKLAGAEDDGVEIGKNLCYRCKNGGRPQVMVFTRSSDEQVVKLVQKLDAALGENSSKQLRAFVNVMGEDKSSATKEAKKLASASKAKEVPFVLPNEVENGPDNYGLNAKAAVTIIMAEGGKVKANHAFASASDVAVDAVIADLAKILN
ncbi:MAG TPA: hypothetical protein VMM76_25610 [Pirellulaceae bacterium]|nr:hypothetical protein [Pirellulaceae bacterium]